MQTSEISFDLTNSSADTDVMAVLVPSMIRRNGVLAGKFLKSPKFKDVDGAIDINVANELPGGSISELDEYASQLVGVKVTAISIGTDNLTQATQNFVQKNYIQFKPAESQNIATSATLVAGESAVMHTFATPFSSGPMNSLEMKILAGETVKIKMSVQLPEINSASYGTLPALS